MEVTQTITLVTVAPEELQLWLEWAGGKLISLPVRHLKPSSSGSLWPDYVKDSDELPKDFAPLMLPAPTRDEIPMMDLILSFPSLATDVWQRKILQCRSLRHPLNGKYFSKWSKIALLLHTDAAHVKRLHKKGLIEVSKKVGADDVRKVRGFFV